VEDGDAAQLSAVPLGLVLVELGVDGLQERPHERNLHGRAHNGALEPDVLCCRPRRQHPRRRRPARTTRDGPLSGRTHIP